MTSREFRPSTLVPKEDSASQDTQGSLAEELFLEGIVMRSCSDNDIEFSNALLVKVSDKGKAPDKYKKIQDKVFFKAYAKICCQTDLCKRVDCERNDAYAAEIVVEKLEGLHEENVPDNDYISNIKVIDLPQTDSESTVQRKGIRYICRKTGYTEIACPIKLYDRTMGALIVGQIIEENNLESWENTITELCRKSRYSDEKTEELLNERKRAKSEKEVQSIISKVFHAVQAIEKELKDVYKNRQEQYSLEQSNIYIEKFKTDLDVEKGKIASSTDKANVYPATVCIKVYESVGTCIRNCVKDICKKIGIETYALFLPDMKNLTDNKYHQLRCNRMILNLDHFLNNSTSNPLCGKDNILQYLESNIGQEYDYMLVSKMEGYPIALLLCLDECLKDISSEEEKSLLTESIHCIFKKTFSFAQMAGIEAKSEYFRAFLDSSMSIMRHELGQSNAGYQMLLEQFRTNVERYSKNSFQFDHSPKAEESFQIFMEYCENMIQNSEEYLYTTRIRMNSTKYLTEFKPKVKQLFYPYEEFLFKWQQIYNKAVTENNLQFQFPHVFFNDLSRPRMYGDPMMIEQAVYNLTNNAIKYAMQGTKVSLDCRLNEDKTKYEIVVKNIGMPFKSQDEVDEIFEYGVRGSNNEKEGSGLGLFLTRQIALGHGGNAECKVERLSKYNWSLMQLYIDFYEDNKIRNLCKDKELYEELKIEWESKKDDIRKNIVREIPRTAFTPMYVHQNIRRKTAQFIFTFWIPYAE